MQVLVSVTVLISISTMPMEVEQVEHIADGRRVGGDMGIVPIRGRIRQVVAVDRVLREQPEHILTVCSGR